MAKPQRRWLWVRTLASAEKAEITAACERFIANFLKPRFLAEVQPAQSNYPIDIYGKWRGSKYSFIARYGSGFPDNPGVECDATFARLDHVEECLSETRFNAMWRRHTGQWWRLHSSMRLEEALRAIETDSRLQPLL